MAIERICPNCRFSNQFTLDELLGRYARCKKCSFLLKVIEEEQSRRTEKRANKKRKR